MKRRPKGLIEEFYTTEENKPLVFRLIKVENKYYIKRCTHTIVVLQEESKARKGFQRLRARWSVPE